MKNRILLSDKPDKIDGVYTPEMRARLGVDSEVFTKETVLANPELFRNVTEIFTTWGMPHFTEAEIAAIFPSLQNVYYAAGTVQGFAREFLNRGVRVFSAWAANAIPVAEFTVSEIVLCMKGFFWTVNAWSCGNLQPARKEKKKIRGNYQYKVGILGAGMVGKEVIRLLKNYACDIFVFDPFLPDEKAAELGVTKMSLEEIFSTCDVVSNHLANNAQTKGMLKGTHFAALGKDCFFINTGRGAQIVESEMTDVLAERKDLTVLLDVTYPEPPAESSPLYSLQNVILTPHIAGSLGREYHRMALYMAEEADRVAKGEPARWEVTIKMLETMA